MTSEIPGYSNNQEILTGRHRVALPPIVGWKIYGDISTAVDVINKHFASLGTIEYELSEDQSQQDFELPLVMSGLVRVRVNDRLILPRNPLEASTLREALIDEVADVNFLRVSEEKFFGEPDEDNLVAFSKTSRDSQIRAEQARQVMEADFYGPQTK